MSETTVQQWLDRYAEVQRTYADAMEAFEASDYLIQPSSSVYEAHDDALAELAHEAATIFTLERVQGRLTHD